MTDLPASLALPASLTLAEGVVQYFADDGAPDGAGLLLYHHGTPAAGPLDPVMVSAARDAHLRLVELVRPGYGGSTRSPGRSVASVAPLAAALADALGHDRFVTIGWSGGGPHAIATAALLPDRCAGAISLAGVAPMDAEGLNWLAGMGEDNWHEFGAALAGEWFLERFLAEAGAELAAISPDDVTAAMASLLAPVDRDLLRTSFAATMAAELRWSVSTGVWGWHDDDLAFVQPWGFDLADVRVPIHVWHGTADLMVPVAHGHWLARNVPGAHAHVLEGQGHLSVSEHLGVAFREVSSLLAD
ncbi:MAG: alpha/beta hydrolase [Actinomycetota bacterium]|nr:alpha/beta hydrolase [Actinomycetota bacterium]